METYRAHPQTLNYFQQSPVRGQLEPADGTTGDRRFLQCTDIPNELKVLLPARTSVLYENLLTKEADELKKGEHASWDRIKEIRRLKERMIRKCERLARASMPEKRPGYMLTLYAPPDLRLREMERWLKEQKQGTNQLPASYSCCSMCGPLGVPPNTAHPTKHVSRVPAVIATRTAITSRDGAPLSHRSSLQSVALNTTPSLSRTASNRTVRAKHTVVPDRVPKQQLSSSSTQTLVEPDPEARYYIAKHGGIQQISLVKTYAHPDKVAAVPSVIRRTESPPKRIPYRGGEKRDAHIAHASRTEDPLRSLMQSPDPLPIPWRSRVHHEEGPNNTANGHEAGLTAKVETHAPATTSTPTASPPADLDAPKVLPEEPAAKTPGIVESPPAPTTGVPLETIHERPGEHEDIATQHPLMRRRSSLKKKGSMHSLASQTKSVTWAMDRDWMDQTSKFIKVTNEADVAAYELEQGRLRYHEEIAMVRIICQDTLKAAQKLGLNVDELKSEETALALQQYKVATISESIEGREARYKDAVLAVLEETKRIVQLCDKKRENHEDC